MIFLTESEVMKAITMKEAIDVLVQAYRDYAHGLIDVPPRISIGVREQGDDAIILAANYRSIPYYGLKEASSFPSNVRKKKSTVMSNIQVYSADTGELLAVISANYLTAVKTGAASAVATRYMAREDAAVLAIIGTGIQARTQLLAIQEVRPLTEVRVYDLDGQRKKDFAAYVEDYKNRDYRVELAETSEKCVLGADIIVTATTSSTPVLQGGWLSAGTHLNCIGSFTPSMQEVDSSTVSMAHKIICDHREEVWQVAGDLLVPLQEGLITRDKLYGELGDVVAGKLAGRENRQEITLYESVGFGALDIAIAVAVYQNACKLGLGLEVGI
jgi:ornithine cyclodeaminase/alanine dehydrogenase-like protein (mu-crystallin family)